MRRPPRLRAALFLALALGALPLLGGCAYDSAAEVGTLEARRDASPAALLRARLGTLLRPAAPAPAPVDPRAVRAAITPELVARLRAPTLFAALNGAASLPQRVALTDGTETYRTEDGITLSLRGGLVVATRGLGYDVMESDVDDALAALRTGRGRATRTHAWPDGTGGLVRRSFDCRYGPGPLGVREECFAIGLRFVNDYAMGGGRALASRQWLGPVLGHISLEQLRL